MKRIIATIAVAVALTSVPAPSSATRPIPGYPYTDQCNNFAGVQPIYMLIGSGPYREDESTGDPNDCVFRSKYPFGPPRPASPHTR